MNSTPETSAGRHYSHTIQLSNQHDVHALGVAAVPVGSSVLDVGCADGSFSQHLLQRGCQVVGIDFDPDALKLAASVLPEVHRVDLMADLDAQLSVLMEKRNGDRFDVIVAMDVLEHVTEPTQVLRSVVRSCLARHGRVVMSVPNIAHGSIRLSLLDGQFEYRPAGLLDRTHLRFFTNESIGSMLTDAGLRPVIQVSVDREIDATEVAINVDRYPAAVIDAVRADPESFTYQYFVVGVPIELSDAGSTELYTLVSSARQLADQEAARRTLNHAVVAEKEILLSQHSVERSELQTRLAELETAIQDATTAHQATQLQLQQVTHELDATKTLRGYLMRWSLRQARRLLTTLRRQ